MIFYDFFVFARKINAKINAKITAAAIPPEVASKPHVKIPIMPFVLTALIAPFARLAPKPTIGTEIPAPATL